MIFVTKAEGGVSFVSPEWTAFTGQAADDAVGHGWFTCVHPDDREPAITFLRSARDQQSEFSLRLRLRRVDQSYAWVMIGAVPSYGPPLHHGDRRQRLGTVDRLRHAQPLRPATHEPDDATGLDAGGRRRLPADSARAHRAGPRQGNAAGAEAGANGGRQPASAEHNLVRSRRPFPLKGGAHRPGGHIITARPATHLVRRPL